ncbi:winged helix-turn-helix domain-containing protein [Dyella caseinilytica]|uniref:Winged helix-turn-helix domain-containing protein n=1 Tax=Dyella caseinilytica TaxID=1849581 RepID=A0ABX7GX95_9GAMM|nr:winged helix-turn-helix domain-containing protein [Dyella caseinilytica]QRN54899.1 winged helix-turn-helix domain-containing protein [Dyella caseinilytica]
MARTARGKTDLTWAREQVASARTADELRQAQASLLSLELGLSLEQTAMAIGRSVSLTYKLRNQCPQRSAGRAPLRKRKAELRNRAIISLEREARLLDEVLGNAACDGVIVISRVKATYEKALGRPIALSTFYRALARHGWRKLAPDPNHESSITTPQRDASKRSRKSFWQKR